MKRIKVAVDVDGVLADFIGRYNEIFSEATEAQVDAFWKNPPYWFWSGLSPITDPKDFWDALDGCEITFLTNCPNPKARLIWLTNNGFWREGCALWCNPVGQPKTEPLRRLKPDLFIDDHQKQINYAVEAGVKNTWLFNNKCPSADWSGISDFVADINCGW